jgi:hypothetical protein
MAQVRNTMMTQATTQASARDGRVDEFARYCNQIAGGKQQRFT